MKPVRMTHTKASIALSVARPVSTPRLPQVGIQPRPLVAGQPFLGPLVAGQHVLARRLHPRRRKAHAMKPVRMTHTEASKALSEFERPATIDWIDTWPELAREWFWYRPFDSDGCDVDSLAACILVVERRSR